MECNSQQWRQDKLRCALVICWLLTVAVSFFNAYLFPIEVPSIGTWYAFRAMLPLTAILYVICAVREKRSFWKDSTALEKWCYVFIAVMLLYGTASLLRAFDISWTFRRLLNLCFDMCFLFLMLRLCRNRGLRKLTLAICVIMWVAVMLMGIYEVFNGGIVNSTYNDYKRFYVFNKVFQFPVVFMGNTNDYALMLVFFYAIFLLTAWREPRIPQWVTVILTALTYFLLLATSSRLCILAFFILLAAQILCALIWCQKAARRTAATMLLCVFCIHFCNQYHFIVPPIERYLHQRAEYTQAVKDAENKVQIGGETSSAQQEITLEKPKLQVGDPRKESLSDQFFETDDATGEKTLRSAGSAGIRSHLLLHALDCFRESHGLGIGLGNTEVLAARRSVVPEWANNPQNSIHCFVARIIADYGIFVLIPLCAIAFLLLKCILTSLFAAWKCKDGEAVAKALLFFAVLLIYPLVSTASSDAQDDIPMWIYLSFVILSALEFSYDPVDRLSIIDCEVSA